MAVPSKPSPAPAHVTSAPLPPDPDDRREFFSDAMREVLGPFAGILERKINPLLAALEAIPTEVDQLTSVTLPSLERVLDQPQLLERVDRTVSLVQRAAHTIQHNSVEETRSSPVIRYLRPPGALSAGAFESTCSRCGKCVEVCPAAAIRMDPACITADGLPYIVAAEQACVVCDSLACMKQCPTGALKPLDRLQIHMGTARVDHYECLRDRGEDCRLCVETCPIIGDGAGGGPDAITIHPVTGKVSVRKAACIGCGLCESRCPTEPRAIQVIPPRSSDPIVA